MNISQSLYCTVLNKKLRKFEYSELVAEVLFLVLQQLGNIEINIS